VIYPLSYWGAKTRRLRLCDGVRRPGLLADGLHFVDQALARLADDEGTEGTAG